MLVNDIIINISHKHYLFCYDWDKKDQYLNLKQIPLVYIDKIILNKIIYRDTKVSDQFINQIKNKASLYNNKKYSYLDKICILTDGLKALAIVIDNSNKIIRRSGLLFDEEQEVVSFTVIMKKEKYDFEFNQVIDYNIFLTKKENQLYKRIKKDLIVKDNYDKIKYWNYLLTGNTAIDIDEIKKRLNSHEQIIKLIKVINY